MVPATCTAEKTCRRNDASNNKPVALRQVRSVIIAIFAEHSTLAGSNIIIP
jgi:hypothetical protein